MPASVIQYVNDRRISQVRREGGREGGRWGGGEVGGVIQCE